MWDITVDPKGVATPLDGLNVHKASGQGGLNARVLKECSNEVSPILALYYNDSLAREDVPDEWLQANVSTVFKKGENDDAANYRPVSITCICCKTLEHILVSNINRHLALDSIFVDCQHGFRSQRSCETQLVQFVHDIISNLDGAVNRGHKQTDLIIMDFAKAFALFLTLTMFHTRGYYTNWNFMGLEDPPTIESIRGSLYLLCFRLDYRSVSIHKFSYLMRPCQVLNSTMSCFEQCHSLFFSFYHKRLLLKFTFD